MGQKICDCLEMQQPFYIPLKIQKKNFEPLQKYHDLLQSVMSLSNNQISNEISNQKWFKNDTNTFFMGQFCNDVAQNHGALYIPEKTLYYGSFINGQLSGNGVLKLLTTHHIYKGQFLHGAPNGKGTFINQRQGFTFQGTWKKQSLTSMSLPVDGTLKLHNNNLINQIIFESFTHKFGVVHYKNGSKYTGFINDELIPNGNGKMEFQSQNRYDGEWLNGKFHGFGTYSWKKGQIYKGEYLHGQKNGEGTFYYLNGKCFKGTWKNGKREGLGKIINTKGLLMVKGIYENDVLNEQKTKVYLQSQMQKAHFGQVKSELMQDENEGKKTQGQMRKQKVNEVIENKV